MKKMLVTIALLGSLKAFGGPVEEARKTLGLSYFNTAKVLAEVRENKAVHVCETEAYKSELVDVLQKALLFDPTLNKKIPQTKILPALADTVYLRQAMNIFDPYTGKGLEWTIGRTHFSSAQGGAMGPQIEITFKTNNTVEISHLIDNGDTFERKITKGTWSAKFDASQQRSLVSVKAPNLSFDYELISYYGAAEYYLAPIGAGVESDADKSTWFTNIYGECEV